MMKINRREFGHLAGGLAGVISVLSLPACDWLNLYGQISKYVPMAVVAFNTIVQILVEHGIPVGGLTDAIEHVKAALADIQAAILVWKEAHGDQKNTAIAIIRTALTVAQTSLEDFWSKLQLPNPLAATIKALLDVITSTLAGFKNKLPGAAAKLPGARNLFAAPQMRSIREFREDFNRVLQDAGESKHAI